jgi:hypothetical protein
MLNEFINYLSFSMYEKQYFYGTTFAHIMLFRIGFSFLAYPNLFGIKGFIVVIVVVTFAHIKLWKRQVIICLYFPA